MLGQYIHQCKEVVMTTPSSARTLLAAPRQLAAWALVGYAALYLMFTFFGWVLPGASFAFRSANAGYGFTALPELALPVLAVLLATAVEPPLRLANLISMVALLEYAVILLLGLITLLIGLGSFGDRSDDRVGYDVMSYFLLGVGRLGLAAIAGLVVYRAWVRLGGSLPQVRVTMGPPAPPAA
jgi:hypothetical protein